MEAEPLTDDTVRFTFESEIVLDSRSTDLSAYEISVVSGPGEPVSIREVLIPQDSRTSTFVILVVDKPSHGTHYRVTATGINGRDGGTVTGAGDFISRRTKTEDILRTIPGHYNTAAPSLLRAVFTAIGIEDELIGGSRNDLLGAVDLGVLLLEDGTPLLTEDLETILLEE